MKFILKKNMKNNMSSKRRYKLIKLSSIIRKLLMKIKMANIAITITVILYIEIAI